MPQSIALPYEVNPGIKLTRWILLIAGIFYGVTKHRTLSRMEIPIREQEKKRRELRKERIERERIIAGAAELIELELLFLGPPAITEQPEITTGVPEDNGQANGSTSGLSANDVEDDTIEVLNKEEIKDEENKSDGQKE